MKTRMWRRDGGGGGAGRAFEAGRAAKKERVSTVIIKPWRRNKKEGNFF